MRRQTSRPTLLQPLNVFRRFYAGPVQLTISAADCVNLSTQGSLTEPLFYFRLDSVGPAG